MKWPYYGGIHSTVASSWMAPILRSVTKKRFRNESELIVSHALFVIDAFVFFILIIAFTVTVTVIFIVIVIATVIVIAIIIVIVTVLVLNVFPSSSLSLTPLFFCPRTHPFAAFLYLNYQSA